VEVLGADRLVFGTDFPYVDRYDLRRPIHDVLAAVPGAARVPRRLRRPPNSNGTNVIDHPYVFIGGQWVRTHSTEVMAVSSANTEQVIGSVPAPDPVDVDTAVRAARVALRRLVGVATLGTRRQGLRYCAGFADALDKRSGEIAVRVSDQKRHADHRGPSR